MMRSLFSGRLLQAVAVAAVIVVVTEAVVVGLIWLGGGLHTSDRLTSWTAIGALAALGSAVATVLAVGTLAFAGTELENRARELATQAKNERVARMPYLRVDIGLEGHNAAGFSPPNHTHVFDAADFGLAESMRIFAPIEPTGDTPGMSLVLWVHNLQTAPLGIAYNVVVQVLVAWDQNDPGKAALAEVGFTYLAANQVTAFKLASVATTVPWLFIQVLGVTYEDVFGEEPLTDVHGALRMVYDPATGTRNERSYQLSR